MFNPISHAEMLAAVRRVIFVGLIRDDDLDELQAVLLHLERTQPTDTQADLTERARAVWHRIADGNMAYAVTIILAALQSEREAAAAEARKFRDMFDHLKQKAEIAGREDTLKIMREIEAAYALASPPAPQEETPQ